MDVCDFIRDPTDAARYSDMHNALQEHYSRDPGTIPPRDRAFHSALRSVLNDIENEGDAGTRHLRITAGYQWFVKHRPRPRAQHPEWAAAMAASLSVPHYHDDEDAEDVMGRLQSGGMGLDDLLRQASDDSAGSSNSADREAEQQFLASYRGGNSRSSVTGFISSWTGEQGQQQQQQQQGQRQQQQQQRGPPRHHGHKHSSTGGGWSSNGDGEERACQPAASQSGSAATAAAAAAAAAQRAAHHNLCGAFDRWLAISPTPDDLHLGGPQGPATSSSTQPGGPSSSSSSSSAARHPAAVYLEQRQQWADAHLKQAALLGDVATRMAAYAAGRARAEGEVLRKQEAKLLGAPSRQQQQQGQGQQQRGSMGSPGRGAAEVIAPATRVLLHMDSQHQPPLLSAYHQPQSAAASQLVPPNPLRDTKLKLQQESQQEAAAAGSRLATGGLACDGEVLRRALVPLPDQPFLTCVGSLPRPGAGLVSVPGSEPGAGEVKKKKKATKSKEGGGKKEGKGKGKGKAKSKK